MSEQKIKAPQYERDKEREAARREAVEQAKNALVQEQRRVLDEDPLGAFKYRMPLDARGQFTGEELAEIQNAEEIAYTRHRNKAQEKSHQRHMWSVSGGDEAEFEENWQEYGEALYTHQQAEAAAQRATSPY